MKSILTLLAIPVVALLAGCNQSGTSDMQSTNSTMSDTSGMNGNMSATNGMGMGNMNTNMPMDNMNTNMPMDNMHTNMPGDTMRNMDKTMTPTNQ